MQPNFIVHICFLYIGPNFQQDTFLDFFETIYQVGKNFQQKAKLFDEIICKVLHTLRNLRFKKMFAQHKLARWDVP